MTPQSVAHKKLFTIVTDAKRTNAMKHCAKFLHTGALEVIHNVKLKYLPKNKSFSFQRNVIFMMLVAIEVNLNSSATDKKTYRQYSKAQKGYTLKSKYKRDNLTYKLEMMDTLSKNLESNSSGSVDLSRYKLRPFPKTFHGTEMPTMLELTTL